MMKAVVLIAALFFLSAIASAEPLALRVDAYLRAYNTAGQFSGVVLIANGNQVVYSRALGFADLRSHRRMQMDTVFPLASLSKAFTGAAIIDLQRRARVAFSDPLARTWPDFPNAQAITIDQLLRHTSGVGLLEDPALLTGRHSVRDYLPAVAAAPPLFAPAKGDEYSNEGYLLLAVQAHSAPGATTLSSARPHRLSLRTKRRCQAPPVCKALPPTFTVG